MRSCSATRLLVDKLSATETWTKSRARKQAAAAPKGCDVRPVMRRDVAKSLNRDHRALHPVLAQDLCGRRLISINLSTRQLNENVSWIDWRTMEPLLQRSNITGICSRRQQLKLGESSDLKEAQNEHILRLACFQTVVRDPCSRPRRRCDRPALAPARGPAVRSISARAALHAWPRPKMAREARARCKLIKSSP